MRRPLCLMMVAVVLVACRGEEVHGDTNATDIDFITDCGDEECDLEIQVCCMDGAHRGGCEAEASCTHPLFCDGPEDCTEEEDCCGSSQGNECGVECDLVVCHDSDDCAHLLDAPVCRESVFVEMNYCKPE
ncbi:MAG: hypothetical protein JRI25_25750 [Deltaproteobacteria bacterium]|nr:hypothetical protein [Deltaproteobacteria bacterium]MBW2257985.1 hypothetical protein [Deltaproteobacteria bacterium]